jgi:cation diffusion facilitator CzcD-associated flavoprotein CzcO
MLFQRTPPWILPRLDRQISARKRALFRALPLAQRFARGKIYLQRELLVRGFVHQPSLMQRGERLALYHMEAQVADQALREKLRPQYRMGCKRILLSDDFYPAITQSNVELVTERIREIRATSILTEDGAERACNTIILATGFHATDMPLAYCVNGRDGQALAAAWCDGPRAYLGTTVAGFPNLFILIGPNTGLGHSSMIFMIESQLAYILDCLRLMARQGVSALEVRPEAQESFNAEMRRRMGSTIWASGCASWYLDVGGYNASLWPGFTWEYRRRTRRFDLANYRLMPRTVFSPV